MFGKKPAIGEHRLLGEKPANWSGPPLNPAGIDPEPQTDPDLVTRISQVFFGRIDSASVAEMTREQLSFAIVQVVSEIVTEEKLQLSWREQSAVAKEILDDIVGIGPIEDLLSDDTISDILVNGPQTVYVERAGRLEQTNLRFRDDSHVFEVARRIANSVGRRLDEASPMVDARLPDGSRVNVIAPPLSVNGTIISIRKFSRDVLGLKELQARGTLSGEICRFLEIAAKSRLNILISGGTGSGKTTLLNAISGLINDNERVVTIEDAAEIRLQSPHVVSLETRQRNSEGTGEVSQRDLLRNCLRMRPDRIIIGEVRGSEAHDMLQAMNTGHDGSMSTIHANSTRDALIRLENLVATSQPNIQGRSIRQQIVSAVDLLIHLERLPEGVRVIETISEVVGIEGEVITLQELFKYNPSRRDEEEAGGSEFTKSGVRPRFAEKVLRHVALSELPSEIRAWNP